jgi:hypothetical protein
MRELGVHDSRFRIVTRSLERDRGALAATGAAGTSQRAMAELSSLLLPEAVRPLLAKHRKVLIIPHGVLALAPWNALTVPGTSTPLSEEHSLRFAPSLGILNGLGRPDAPSGSRAIRGCTPGGRCPLVVGNPSMPSVTDADGNTVRLSQLPGSESESHEVAKLLGTSALTGTAASEMQVRRRVRRAPVIHLATHGFAFTSAAEAGKSFVALAADSATDGLLTMDEVVNAPELAMTAELVVLSACQSGLGSLTDAEGTVGLQRGFLARGAKSVLVSLWNVSDEATRLLMTRFYAHWLDDRDAPSKPEALRRAQEDVRALPAFSHPRFWAAFQLAGLD